MSEGSVHPSLTLRALTVSRLAALHGLGLGFADGALLAQFRAAAKLTGFLVVFALAKFLGQPAAFQQFLEAPQGRANRFSIMDTHS